MKKLLIFSLAAMVLAIGLVGAVSAKNDNSNQYMPSNAPANEISLLENAKEVAPGVFYLGKSMNKGKVVEGYAFVHYAKDSDRAKKAKPTQDDSNKYKLLGVKWADTIQYEVNTAGSNFVGAGDVTGILEDSLETWDTAITSDFELFNDVLVPTTETFVGGTEPDYINRIVWQNFGGPGTIAYNSYWFYTATREMIESDVVFNSYYDWADCIDGGVDCSNKMDLQSIATHEFGHNGLADLYNRPARPLTMYGYSGFGETKKQDLATGDMLGIQALYGN